MNKRIEAVIKVTAALYDKAAAYTNLIIIAGYAAFFAVWGNVRIYLGKREILYAALFMIISLVCFVVWETTKMFITAKSLNGFRNAVIGATPEDFNSRLQELQNAEAKLMIKFMYIWYFVLAICVGFGLSAAALLINGFLRELIYS